MVEVDWHDRPKTRNAILGNLALKGSSLVSKLKSPIRLLSHSLQGNAQTLVHQGTGNRKENLR